MARQRVDLQVGPSEIAILINGLPHMILRRQELDAVQSYYKTTGVRDALYFIEFTTRHGVVVADYPDRALWENILAKLKDAHLFDHMLGTAPLPGSA